MALFNAAVAGMDTVVLATFADVVEYFPRQGSPYTLTGVLNHGEVVQEGERVYMTLWAPLANFTAGEPRKADIVTFEAVTYRVADVEKDFTGGRLLKLAVTNPQ